ncbi:SpaH/EbpB family LPXTG-anchored major pilin [Blautia sp. MSJ-19]|uniref:SpaH/EbpB family LPXTG-anchored major pilin n=1 Tax=Blautia sp. MSJ-19 TaxID=2841517 RepID=UPI001C0F2B66|nr:SpaH/EbpB family LPXTG-anchored major pilin [Blautia sp. MSJ-19]MBU5482665.1 SpaH/EbpB family LPXTG-anchored major pilin [Blautia sp. MSJ-19]
MKKRILKRVLSAVATAALLVGGGSSVVSADTADNVTYTPVDSAYYTGLGLTGDPSLTIAKYIDGNDANYINGVTFKYAKVGDLYQVENTTQHTVEMAYCIDSAFATAAGLTSENYSENGNLYYTDPAAINTQLQAKSIQEHATAHSALRTYLANDSIATVTTADTGTVSVPNVSYGLYLIAEWNTSGATDSTGKPISITNIQSPFVVAIPTDNNGTWNKEVVAKVKNAEGSAEVEKKIVTNDNVENPELDDTDTTSIGDTVTFQLHGTVPVISKDVEHGNAEKINKYVLTDNLSKGLTPVETENAKDLFVKATAGNTNLVYDTDYTYEISDYTETKTGTASTTEAEYAGGKTITVTFTTNGLAKLDTLAQNGGGDVYFYYKAKVNDQAVIGPNNGNVSQAGNPNEVKLNYQIGTSSEMETGWDKVTEYTFGIDVIKQLAGDEKLSETNAAAIKFILYSKEGNTETYYKLNSTTKGVYTVDTSVTNITTEISPADTTGRLYIKGLDEGTYYLKEKTTAGGYNLLKEPVEIVIKANKNSNTYVGTSDQYIGTITNDGTSANGTFELTINNTKGFTLPATGGAGIWFFVLAGVVIVAAGCGYYMISSRKNRSK